MVEFKISTKNFTGEEGPYQSYGITAKQGLLSVSVNDITTKHYEAVKYVDRLK